MRHRKEKRQKRLGPMPLTKQIEQLPSYQRMTLRFGLTTDLNTAPEAFKCFTWLKTLPQVKEALPTTVTRKDGVTTEVRQVEAALATMTLQEICALRVKWVMHSALH